MGLTDALGDEQCDKVPKHVQALKTLMQAEWKKMQEEKKAAAKESKVAKKAVNLKAEEKKVGKTKEVNSGKEKKKPAPQARSTAPKGKQEPDAQETARAAMHTAFLEKARGFNHPCLRSPVGKYIIDCDSIEGQWSNLADNMTLSIHHILTPFKDPEYGRETYVEGVWKATFDFGVIQGFMILGADEGLLDKYCGELESGYGNDVDYVHLDEDEEDDKTAVVTTGSKRKAPPAGGGGKGGGRPSKVAKTTTSTRTTKTVTTYHLRMKFRETGEGQIFSKIHKGSMTFRGKEVVSFSGKADMGFVGGSADVVFSGRKVSPTPAQSFDKWANYSAAACERACVSRWR